MNELKFDLIQFYIFMTSIKLPESFKGILGILYFTMYCTFMTDIYWADCIITIHDRLIKKNNPTFVVILYASVIYVPLHSYTKGNTFFYPQYDWMLNSNDMIGYGQYVIISSRWISTGTKRQMTSN